MPLTLYQLSQMAATVPPEIEKTIPPMPKFEKAKQDGLKTSTILIDDIHTKHAYKKQEGKCK